MNREKRSAPSISSPLACRSKTIIRPSWRYCKKQGSPWNPAHEEPPTPSSWQGGVACFLNPEPIAPFIDCFLLGEAEINLPLFLEKVDPAADRSAVLTQIAHHVPGAYVPAFYTPSYKADGTLLDRVVLPGISATVKPPRFPDLAAEPAFNSIIATDTTFEDTYLVEVARGCPHGCRFCSAGFVYRPPRFQSLETLKGCLAEAAERTSKVGLVGTAVADLPGLHELCHLAGEKNLQVSFSSLRADALDAELINTLRSSGVKTATIAPDAGSERMRRVINKGMNETEILTATAALVTGGIPNLKLYFMVGLPWESAADVEAIIRLTQKIKARFLEASRSRKKIGTITVSINAFVPKPFTPFQWCPMEDRRTLQNKIKTLRKALQKIPNVRVQSENLRWSYIQALFARGDRRVADLLKSAHAKGGNWAQTFKETDQDPDFYVTRTRETSEHLPWEFIDHGLKRAFLLSEYHRAREAKTTPACALENCHLCGVCQTARPPHVDLSTEQVTGALVVCCQAGLPYIIRPVDRTFYPRSHAGTDRSSMLA